MGIMDIFKPRSMQGQAENNHSTELGDHVVVVDARGFNFAQPLRLLAIVDLNANTVLIRREESMRDENGDIKQYVTKHRLNTLIVTDNRNALADYDYFYNQDQFEKSIDTFLQLHSSGVLKFATDAKLLDISMLLAKRKIDIKSGDKVEINASGFSSKHYVLLMLCMGIQGALDTSEMRYGNEGFIVEDDEIDETRYPRLF